MLNSFQFTCNKDATTGVGIMRRYGSSWTSQSKANVMPPHPQLWFTSWQPCPGMHICWMRAVFRIRVITRRCVGRFWNVWRQQNSLVAGVRQQQYAVVRSAVDRRDLREAAEHEEIKVNGTAVTGRRPPLRGSVKNGLCTLHLLMPVLATVSLSTAAVSRAVSN